MIGWIRCELLQLAEKNLFARDLLACIDRGGITLREVLAHEFFDGRPLLTSPHQGIPGPLPQHWPDWRKIPASAQQSSLSSPWQKCREPRDDTQDDLEASSTRRPMGCGGTSWIQASHLLCCSAFEMARIECCAAPRI